MLYNESDGFIMNNAMVQIICGILICVSIFFYLWAIPKLKKTARGNLVISSASQLTFSTYMIGFALILIVINIQGMSQQNFIESCLLHATVICMINALSIVYYYWRLPKE